MHSYTQMIEMTVSIQDAERGGAVTVISIWLND